MIHDNNINFCVSCWF